ncbi:MAG: FadD3 family acyl-CoA ligase [Acidimicrobiales bacterium]
MNADTIPALVAQAAERFGDREALVDGDVRLTFRELASQVERAAGACIASGVDAGDRVAIWAPNIAEWVFAALGLHMAGAVLVPLNTRFKAQEARHVLAKAGVRRVFTVAGFLDQDYLGHLHSISDVELDEVVVLRGDSPPGTTPWARFLDRAEDVSGRELGDRAGSVAPTDTCDILFTSGTTGAPKGAMLAHSASIRAYTAWAGVVGLREGDRYLIVNPFFHAFGLKAGILACLVTGSTIVPHAVFDVPSVMRRVAEERISMLPGPPAIYQTMLDHPDLGRLDMSSLRLAVTGAATVPVEMIMRMRRDLPFETIVTGYGLTEATGIATMCRHDDDDETIAHTAGRAIPDVEVVVVDDGGARLDPGTPGELLVRGYNVMAGYYDDREATAAAIDAEGWLHTGDVAVMDEGGYVRITDRKKDMFIVGGFNAYPAEIENLMLAHPGIAQVAVVGIPDPRLGEVAMAFVVGRPNADPPLVAEDLVAWCRERMANFKVPRRVELVPELPMNASNKVVKHELRARALASLAKGR